MPYRKLFISTKIAVKLIIHRQTMCIFWISFCGSSNEVYHPINTNNYSTSLWNNTSERVPSTAHCYNNICCWRVWPQQLHNMRIGRQNAASSSLPPPPFGYIYVCWGWVTAGWTWNLRDAEAVGMARIEEFKCILLPCVLFSTCGATDGRILNF